MTLRNHSALKMLKSNCDSILFLNIAGNTHVQWKNANANKNKKKMQTKCMSKSNIHYNYRDQKFFKASDKLVCCLYFYVVSELINC